LLAFVVLGWTIFSRSAPSSDPSAPHTAVVEIKGEIDAGREASAETVVLAMRGALEDKGSQALVLLINSPGGSPVQAGIINDEIVRLKACTSKPVYAVVEEPAPRPPITLPRRPTRFTWTRPASSAALAC
jgi:protease-4